MKSRKAQKPDKHALFIEWGGLTAGAYGGPAILALLIIVVGLMALKFA